MIASKNIAFVFPGQGSQTVGMGKELAETFPLAAQTFAEADEILNFPLSKLAWDGPEDELNDTVNTQPALLVHSVAALRVLKEQGPEIQPAFVAGHSLGELSALVAANVMAFDDVLNLVYTRGRLMKEAGERSPGGMAAILALDIPTCEKICTTAGRAGEVVQVANDNCPGQVVISGDSNALERAMQAAAEEGARKVVRLAVSIAAHSPLMAHAQDEFNEAVTAAEMRLPEVPVVGNVEARPMKSAEDIQTDLQAQLTSRVRWTESVEYMLDQGVNTFIEIGTGDVLSGLIKRIHRGANRIPIGAPEDLEKLTAGS